MRLFVAFDIDDAIRERIGAFMAQLSELAPAARWVKPESLHVTLRFIGAMPDEKLDAVKRALAEIHAEPLGLTFRGCGFFPTPRSARVFWAGIEAPPSLAGLAAVVEEALVPLGVEEEKRAYSPHLTLARAGGASGSPRRQRGDRANNTFEPLQKKLAELPAPEFGSMNAGQFSLYQSQLSPKGSRYTKLERFGLK